MIGPISVTIWYHYISGWFVRLSLALKAQAYFWYFWPKFEIELQKSTNMKIKLILIRLQSCKGPELKILV
jgi:hypothetical protein